jgi:hypothetical protein
MASQPGAPGSDPQSTNGSDTSPQIGLRNM